MNRPHSQTRWAFALISIGIFLSAQAAVAKSCLFKCGQIRAQEVQKVWASFEDGVTYEEVAELYHQDVYYEDVLGKFEGLDSLYQHWSKLYDKYDYVYFRYDSSVAKGSQMFIRWTMLAKQYNPQLGKTISLTAKGLSDVQFAKRSTKILWQKDYMDPPKVVESLPVE